MSLFDKFGLKIGLWFWGEINFLYLKLKKKNTGRYRGLVHIYQALSKLNHWCHLQPCIQPHRQYSQN